MSGRPMEEYSSWLRRTKFSHTVCHLFDTAKLASVPVRFRTREIPVFKPKPESSGVNNKVPERQMKPQIHQQNPLTNKQRSASPLPQTSVSEVFKEAQLEKKRFSTPVPRRKEPDKRKSKSFNNRESSEKLIFVVFEGSVWVWFCSFYSCALLLGFGCDGPAFRPSVSTYLN